jgi:hypothetical protein
MKKMKFWLSMVLCFAMIFNPLIVQVAVYAADADASQQEEVKNEEMETSAEKADEASEKTDEAYNKLSTTKKAKTKWYMSSSTKRKIREANSKLDSAKSEVGDVKDTAKDAAGEVKSIGDAIEGDGNALDKLAKVKAGIQGALIKTGQLLQKIGQLLKTVGQALQLIGKALSAIPWTAAIGQALMNVGKILYSVGTMLDNIGKVIEQIGQTAADADKGFGDMLGQIFQAGKDGWKQGWSEAEAYEQSLDSEDADTSENMGGTADQTETDTGAGADTVEDVDQSGTSDI